MLELFVAALALGLIFNATPGAVFAETLHQAAQGGFRPALAVQLGSLTGDAAWAALGLAGAGVLMQSDALRLPAGLAGATYLLWLARDAWRAASPGAAPEDGPDNCSRGALRAGVALSMTNPQNIGFWAALGSAMGALGVDDPQPAHYAVFFAGFMTASLAWAFVCAGTLAFAFRRAAQRWIHVSCRLCAAALFGLGLASLHACLAPLQALLLR
jgi:chemosensory pili system protein ChpE/L-lysine exporter family protein LysE/ArgO